MVSFPILGLNGCPPNIFLSICVRNARHFCSRSFFSSSSVVLIAQKRDRTLSVQTERTNAPNCPAQRPGQLQDLPGQPRVHPVPDQKGNCRTKFHLASRQVLVLLQPLCVRLVRQRAEYPTAETERSRQNALMARISRDVSRNTVLTNSAFKGSASAVWCAGRACVSPVLHSRQNALETARAVHTSPDRTYGDWRQHVANTPSQTERSCQAKTPRRNATLP